MTTPARLQNVFYAVVDMPRARLFYERLLGLSLKFADGERWVQYDAEGASFALGSSGEAHRAMSGAAAIFEVADLASYEHLVSQSGGTLLEIRDMGSHGKTMIVRDPDGNIVHLWARSPRADGQPKT